MRFQTISAIFLMAGALAACGGASDTADSRVAPRQLVAITVPAQAPFSGPLANYTITATANGYSIVDKTGKDAARNVPATARLRFTDTSLAFDSDGVPGQAYRVYRAAFARTPDAAGLGFWIGAMDAGTSLTDVANGFVGSAEYKALYASAASNRDIINKYYLNVLGRAGEQAGVDFWTGLLDNHTATPAVVLTGFSESPENKTGTASAIAGGIAYLETGVAYPDAVYSFPLRAAYQSRLTATSVDYLDISGTCAGKASIVNGNPTSTTFENQTSAAIVSTVSLGLTNCSPTSLAWTTLDYFDANYNLIGHVETGAEYDKSNAPGVLPAAVKIGDTAVYATQAVYPQSSQQASTGQRTLSYIIEKDGSANATAIVNLKAVSTDTSGAVQFTRQVRYRISNSGTLALVSIDELYAGSGTHLLYTESTGPAQPPSLTATDTVVGTGAVAVAGKTLTVNYTGWLYDPTKPGFKGAQFDTSVGRGPFSFVLGAGQVIQGWDIGVAGMKVGGKRTLIFPSVFGYGPLGSGPIPGNAALVFDVELIGVQ